MKNARHKESRNRNAGDGETASDVTGNTIANGGSVRPNDGNEQAIDSEDNGKRGAGIANEYVASELSGGYSRTEIETGYYCAPNGDIKPIPNGYYIDTRDGRLKKRRKRNTDNSADGDENQYRTNSGYGETEFNKQTDFRSEKPLNVRGRKKRKTVKEETQKLTMVTLLASGCSAIFTSVALLTKHDHWALHANESKALSEALNDAINTLPAKYYEQISSIVEKWIPWINLCFVASAIIFDRIEQSNKLVEATRYKPRERSDAGFTASGAQASNVAGNSSLGYNQ